MALAFSHPTLKFCRNLWFIWFTPGYIHLYIHQYSLYTYVYILYMYYTIILLLFDFKSLNHFTFFKQRTVRVAYGVFQTQEMGIFGWESSYLLTDYVCLYQLYLCDEHSQFQHKRMFAYTDVTVHACKPYYTKPQNTSETRRRLAIPIDTYACLYNIYNELYEA